MKPLNILFSILVISVSNFSYAGSKNKNELFYQDNIRRVAASQKLTTEEQDSLIFMREEEKLARDVYLTLHEYFDTRVFENIARAEQKHMNAVKRLLNKYEITDPVVDDSIGLFTNPDFSDFYQKNTASEMTISEAIYVGILIEEMDILDLQKSINLINHSDIKLVYENLLRGSRNHLRAFVRKLESMGIVYEALLLEQATANAIVNSPMERGSTNKKRRKGHRWN